jgi:hypothetical protein
MISNYHRERLSAELAKSRVFGWCMTDRALRGLLCVALFLVIIGARFWTIGEFGSDLPFWDQWDAEAKDLYIPYFEGKLTIEDCFAPHNEHRVFFSRVLSLVLLIANGQWDARLQMLTNSLFYALFASGLFLLLTKSNWIRFNVALCAGIALVFALPFGWENTIWGFQSQSYLLVAFAMATLWLLSSNLLWSWPWVVGCLIGFLGLFTMATGLMAPLALLGFVFCLMIRRRQDWRSRLKEYWPTCMFCLLIVSVGLILMVRVEGHKVYEANSVRQFIQALGLCLSWPSTLLSPWWALANWFPFIVLAGCYLIGDLPDERHERLTLCIGIWVLLQAGTTAFARSTIVLSSRYSDMLSVSFLVNLMSIHLVSQGRIRSAIKGPVFTILVIIWLAGNSLGFLVQTVRAVKVDLPNKKFMNAVEIVRTAGYVKSSDLRWLTEGLRSKIDIPYPEPLRLSELLRNPDIRRILPVSVREPLSMKVHRGNPMMFLNTNFESSAPPYYGDRLWGSKPPGGNDMDRGFECVAEKKQELSFVFLYVSGDYSHLFIADARGQQHPLVPLTPKGHKNGHNMWFPAYAYCSGHLVRIGSAITGDSGHVFFTEPKELGLLSLLALVITNNAKVFLVTGIVLFCLALVLSASRWPKPLSVEL